MKIALDDLDWPGWPLEANPYGDEFDGEARRRMLTGSRLLRPYLAKYQVKADKAILEVGPFFIPLIVPDEFADSAIFYWDNDVHALEWLAQNHRGQTFPIRCDLKEISERCDVVSATAALLRDVCIGQEAFDSIIVSQVLNYVDFKSFLSIMRSVLHEDGYVFINNVVDYGLPPHFSEARPTSIPHTLEGIAEVGYSIVEYEVIDSPDTQHQPNQRLIAVAKRA
jgi:hypothetical protein